MRVIIIIIIILIYFTFLEKVIRKGREGKGKERNMREN